MSARGVMFGLAMGLIIGFWGNHVWQFAKMLLVALACSGSHASCT